LIDLHTHTDKSDGTFSPDELVRAALDAGVETLGITDHDTLAGYDAAAPLAGAMKLDLVCGIELSTRFALDSTSSLKSVHLLGYFLHQPPSFEFRDWLGELQSERRERNRRLIARLNSQGVAIELSEVEALGRSLAGRPHFARLLVEKGYVTSTDQAFRRYLGEDAPTYVERDAPHLAIAVQRLIGAGGFPVLAHPIRLGFRQPEQEEAAIAAMRDAGLRGIEVFHSDHDAAAVNRYQGIAKKYELVPSGGSDFHGGAKPHIRLGTGWNSNLKIPRQVIDRMRKAAGEW
jgi:predicted metal-dependent phosphoesterase TrpH